LAATLDAGVFSTERRLRQTLTVPAEAFDVSRSLNDRGGSYLLEFSVEGVYRLRPNVHLTLGYLGRFVSGIARATDQAAFDRTRAGGGNAALDGVFIHGLQFGVNVYWGGRADPNCRSAAACPMWCARTVADRRRGLRRRVVLAAPRRHAVLAQLVVTA